jgi:predicted dehydrogenase
MTLVDLHSLDIIRDDNRREIAESDYSTGLEESFGGQLLSINLVEVTHMKKLKWGILSTGSIARTFAADLRSSQTGVLWAVASRNEEKAHQFAGEFGAPKAYGNYQQLLDDPEVAVVYIAPLHPFHAEWSLRAAQAGKHILCEKPLAMNSHQAEEMIAAAAHHRVFLMEAFMYRCHPQMRKLIELLKSEVIGKVQIISAAFCFYSDDSPENRVMDRKLGGGAILDVGCYCTSMARLIAGVANGLPFAEPLCLQGAGTIGSLSQVDEVAVAAVTFPGEIHAQLCTGIHTHSQELVRIYGTQGMLEMRAPWIPQIGNRPPVIALYQGQDERSKVEEYYLPSTRGLYALEADVVAEYLHAGQAPSPYMSWQDTIGNMKMLDQWLAAIGMNYDE